MLLRRRNLIGFGAFAGILISVSAENQIFKAMVLGYDNGKTRLRQEATLAAELALLTSLGVLARARKARIGNDLAQP
jgi:hypothetical protein